MMSRTLRPLLFIVVGLLMTSILAACGSTPTTTSTTSSGTKTITVPDAMGGTLTLAIPEAMTSQNDTETGLVTITTGTVSMSKPDAFAAGQWGLAVGATPLTLVQAMVPQGQTASPQLLLDAVKNQMTKSVTQVSFNATETTTIGGHTAARAVATSSQGDVILVVLDLGNSYLIATGVTAKGELTTQEPQINAILTSASYAAKS